MQGPTEANEEMSLGRRRKPARGIPNIDFGAIHLAELGRPETAGAAGPGLAGGLECDGHLPLGCSQNRLCPARSGRDRCSCEHGNTHPIALQRSP